MGNYLCSSLRTLRCSVSEELEMNIISTLDRIHLDQIRFYIVNQDTAECIKYTFPGVTWDDISSTLSRYYLLICSNYYETDPKVAVYSLLLLFYLRRKYPTAYFRSKFSSSSGCHVTITRPATLTRSYEQYHYFFQIAKCESDIRQPDIRQTDIRQTDVGSG